ncbi:MAG: Hsp70 family protein [Acidobacteriota bacterium]
MGDRPQYVGIDLGTTNSACAVFDGEAITLVRSASGTLTPSVVRIDARGRVTVGARARKFLETDPGNTRSEFKRLMGTKESIPFPAAGVAKKPEELASEVLRSLRSDVEEQLGFSPTRAVVAVPALFELPQSAATSEAARLAGFERIELLQEPVASALAAGWTSQDARGSWLVYDLGGGTFDASLLETREGLLRVVGHDGDNFLGGRDFDQAVVDWTLGELSRGGIAVDRADPVHALGLRRLRLAAEEARIELSRQREVNLTLGDAFDIRGTPVDVDLVLDRSTLDALVLPLVERSIAVCQRLLTAHGLMPGTLTRVILVGGPTVTPIVKRRVSEALQAPAGDLLDPMILVAQGAAIYAATAGLDARPQQAPKPGGVKVWLQYPAMTSDLTPHVVGRLVDPAADAKKRPACVVFRREGFQTAAPLDEEGAFVGTIELLLRRQSIFAIEGRAADGTVIALDPASFSIVHGLTISDPPLSRTVGVARADDTVAIYFERGTPLPAKRRFTLHTVETVSRGDADSLLSIPIVQGEATRAHLCRLVGSLSIGGAGIQASIPAGSPVELTIEIDRGGRLSAQALVPAVSQVFEQAAQMIVPDVPLEALQSSFDAMRERLGKARAGALRYGQRASLERLAALERSLGDIGRDLEAAKGGDADALQKSRRNLIELDGILEEVELERKYPEIEDEARRSYAWASDWVSTHGSPADGKLLEDAWKSLESALADRQLPEVERQRRLILQLGNSAFYRDPRSWRWLFENAASRVDGATDLARANALVKQGYAAIQRGDDAALRRTVNELEPLLPADVEERRLGFNSGVR